MRRADVQQMQLQTAPTIEHIDFQMVSDIDLARQLRGPPAQPKAYGVDLCASALQLELEVAALRADRAFMQHAQILRYECSRREGCASWLQQVQFLRQGFAPVARVQPGVDGQARR